MASAALTWAYVTCLCPERAVKGSMRSMCDIMEAVCGGVNVWNCEKMRKVILGLGFLLVCVIEALQYVSDV